MTVTQYETRFVDLSLHAAILVPTNRDRVRRFIDGPTFGSRIQMTKETRDDISFQRSVEIARQIEMLRGQGREALSEKRPCHFCDFSGASFRGHLVEATLT